MKQEPTLYYDMRTPYLELHALRAPVGRYMPEFADNSEAYDAVIQNAIEDFETDHNVTIYQLGRSGRHICIEDTEENRAKYDALQKAAIAEARAVWASMREHDEVTK